MKILKLAKIIWDYNFLKSALIKADAILVLGSHDTRIAHYACDLYFQGMGEYLIFSGASNSFTSKIYSTTEAEEFAQVALQRNVPQDKILIENKSCNTAENLTFSSNLLDERNLNFNSFILIQTPNMLRRVFATAKKIWPEKNVQVSSHPISFEEGPHPHLTQEMFIHEIVGDLQRIILYPELGYQIKQDIPDEVMKAYETLVSLGYTGNMIQK